ncbi:MAG TPA: hypothetical protein VME42_08655 [Steroidobacteraceae bacterium]|nr:hypothetical protein [Steroidobacteraceae bacterium]
MLNPDPGSLNFVRGDTFGLAIPAHGEALRSAGAAFLTDAFRRFGSLSRDNRVVAIRRCEPFRGGNSGHKLLLSLQYAHPQDGLHSELFVKFSRDFSDAFRDRRRHELDAEVRLAALSRLPSFPISVPTAYFADFQRESGTGLLITQRIAFGSGGIEPTRPKCMDHEIADALPYYRTIVSTLARLAGAHKAGRLSAQADAYFPFDAEAACAADPIACDERGMRERVARYASFAARCPQLLPHPVATPRFIARLERDAVRFLQHESTVKQFLHADGDYIALCHYNANIDNAWFWREGSGALRCGLLDWGRVRQMNVAYALWGCLCAADLSIWNHLEELLGLFVRELRACGGPRLQESKLRLYLDLYVATMGLATLTDAPALVLSRLPQAADARGPLDPLFGRDDVVRGFLHVFTAFLSLWQRHDFGASLDQALAATGHPSG